MSKVEQIEGFLAAKTPFDFRHSLHFIQGFWPTKGEQVITNKSVTKALSLDGQAIVFNVSADEQNGNAGVHYQLFGTNLSPETISWAEQAISDYLGLHDDLSELYRVGQTDPAFAPIIKELYGYHQVRFLTPFENAVWAILSQRTAMQIAARNKNQLAQSFGPRLKLSAETSFGGEYVAFPEAEAVAQRSRDELMAVVGNVRQVDYLSSVAEAFCTTLRREETATLSREELRARLLAAKGIGEWSAEFILIRGFGRMAGLPKGEKRHQEAVSRYYGKGQPVTETQIAELARPYGAAQGYWAHYLRVAG